MEQGTEIGMDSRSQARSAPCNYACTDSAMQSGMKSAVYIPTKKGKCSKGFSILQINILSVLKGYPDILSYWQIAQIINERFPGNTTEGAVRGALERLYSHDFLIRTRARRAHLMGNRYAFANDPCAFIPAWSLRMESGTEPPTHSPPNHTPSILKEIERKNLSISSNKEEEEHAWIMRLENLAEEDIAFHWPNLKRLGFGTHQIRQIIDRLAQVGKSTKNVLQGMTHAEWALEHDVMRAKEGKTIADPLGYVFSALAKNGAFRPPPGYVSPEESAEQDALEKSKRLKAAQEALLDAELEEWKQSLLPDELEEILKVSERGVIRSPDILLRMHFYANVWPDRKRFFYQNPQKVLPGEQN